MKHIIDKFMNTTIREKMILSYILIALIPFLLFSITSMTLFTRRAEQNISEHTGQMMEQVKTAMDVYIISMEEFSNYIIREMQDVDLRVRSEDNIIWQTQKQSVTRLLDNLKETHQEVAGILIATENDLYISSGMERAARDSFRQDEWYSRAASSPDEVQIINNVTGRNITTKSGAHSTDNVFSMSKAITDPKTGRVLGVLLVDIRHDIISQSIESITIGEKGFVFVMDENQQVVYTPLNTVVYRVSPDWFGQGSQEVLAKRINDETYQVRHIQSHYTGWSIIGVFSMDEIRGNLDTLVFVLIFTLCMTILIIIFFSIKLSETITRPVLRLKQMMKTAESGDFDVRFQAQYKDEVSQLGSSFNHMLERIQNLLGLVYIEQENKRHAEIKILQEQIKPHFLYNTLDTISWMAREYEADDIVRLVEALTNMFRIGLNRGKDYIKISEEINYVASYLHIQKIRYRSKLNYRIMDDDTLWEYEVPKLILQPLVENSIYHGIKVKDGDGHIVIRIERWAEDERCICLSVADDGPGMSRQKQEELNRQMNQPTKLEENQSFGLFYVKERLRLRYGEQFKVRVDSQEGLGTRVEIIIPADDSKGGQSQR